MDSLPDAGRRDGLVKLVAAAIGATLIVGVVGIALRDRDGKPGDAHTSSTPSAASAARPGEGAPSGTGAVRFEGSARSLVTDAPIVGLTSFAVGGGALTLRGRVVSVDGRDLGDGVVSATGAGAGVRSGGRDLRLDAAVRVVRGTVIVSGGTLSGAPVVTVRGVLSFSPTPKQTNSSASSAPPTTAAPVPLASGAKVTPRSVAGGDQPVAEISGANLEWTDAPSQLTVRADRVRHDLSWAGTGHIIGGGVDVAPEFNGLRLTAVDATITRHGASSDVNGTAAVVQVYADGLPKLRTTASIGLRQDAGGIFRVPEALTVPAGQRGRFIWAPRNTGRADMNILRIRPASPDASWVAVRLETAPPMWGGEPHAGVGGDTTGLSAQGSGGLFRSDKAARIDATLGSGKADRREIAFDVPGGAVRGQHVLRVVLEGNFDPITVEVTVTVV